MYFIRDYRGPKLYRPSANPDVILLGQDPTVDTKKRFETVLGLTKQPDSLEAESENLQDYIRDRILNTLGIDENRIIAANLINAYYHDAPNKRIARPYQSLILDTAKEKGINVDDYPYKANGAILHALNFESGFRRQFEDILNMASVLHIITLGEPVFQVIRERYGLLNLADKIKSILADEHNLPREVLLGNKRVSFLPLPHIFNKNNKQWKYYDDFLTYKLARLSGYYQLNKL